MTSACKLLLMGLAAVSGMSAEVLAGETLYNGIVLPSPWPPRVETLTREVQPVPYLEKPPAVIPIDVGRQLLVDNFLIEETDLTRTFHQARYHPASPVVQPERGKPWERGGEIGTSMTFSDGVWYDSDEGLYKIWYWGGRMPATTCYATSKDGIHWKKPVLDVLAGTNIVHTQDRDSSTVWRDLFETDPSRRYKMLLFTLPAINDYAHGRVKIYCSPDGIAWSDPVAVGGPTGDRTTLFYNPFRRVWVYSIREYLEPPGPGRCRRYWEHADLIVGASWKEDEPTFWAASDHLDNPGGFPSEIYNLDCVAYESLLIGIFSLMQGKLQKSNELFVGFSRDGFYWHRPNRQPLMPRSEKRGDWNYDYLQSAGGCCLVVGEELYFYVGARSDDWTKPSAYRSTGLAVLRRDGFASLDAGERGGTLTTRPVRFSGKHLFVNADVAGGQLQAEVLGADGNVIAPFSRVNCRPLRADKTLQHIAWKGADDLGKLSGSPVRFRFSLSRGALYSFWISPDRSGASHGYVAAGGPGLTGPTDTQGMSAYAVGK